MKRCIFRIVIDTEDESVLAQIKQQFTNLPDIEDISFSPYREHPRYAGYIELASTCDIPKEKIEDVLYQIADQWLIDEDDSGMEAEIDWYTGKLFNKHLYYILFQTY